MNAVIFIGLQASGKSSFFKQRFFDSHVRISLDLLRTRHRERRMLELCIETSQSFVVDNTNPTREDRRRYIECAKQASFVVSGYYFQSKLDDCLARNQHRPQRIPDVGLLSTAKKLELPSMIEGFDSLHYVQIQDSDFVVQDWQSSSIAERTSQ